MQAKRRFPQYLTVLTKRALLATQRAGLAKGLGFLRIPLIIRQMQVGFRKSVRNGKIFEIAWEPIGRKNCRGKGSPIKGFVKEKTPPYSKKTYFF